MPVDLLVLLSTDSIQNKKQTFLTWQTLLACFLKHIIRIGFKYPLVELDIIFKLKTIALSQHHPLTSCFMQFIMLFMLIYIFVLVLGTKLKLNGRSDIQVDTWWNGGPCSAHFRVSFLLLSSSSLLKSNTKPSLTFLAPIQVFIVYVSQRI